MVEGTWAQAQINCVADWTVNCNYLSHTSWTILVIYFLPPPSLHAFLSLLFLRSFIPNITSKCKQAWATSLSTWKA